MNFLSSWVSPRYSLSIIFRLGFLVIFDYPLLVWRIGGLFLQLHGARLGLRAARTFALCAFGCHRPPFFRDGSSFDCTAAAGVLGLAATPLSPSSSAIPAASEQRCRPPVSTVIVFPPQERLTEATRDILLKRHVETPPLLIGQIMAFGQTFGPPL